MTAVSTLEFTIEPFVEGNPGPHVLQAIAAAEAFGVAVEFGPFGSSCVIPAEQVGEITGAIMAAAFGHGATHVTLAASSDGSAWGADGTVTA